MMKRFEYDPKGVCSRKMIFNIEDDGTINSVEVIGGCNGNLKGIVSLLKGMNIDEVIKRLDGITCRDKPTSCPDQLAKGLGEYKSHASNSLH